MAAVEKDRCTASRFFRSRDVLGKSLKATCPGIQTVCKSLLHERSVAL
jgi:hypothetical protein